MDEDDLRRHLERLTKDSPDTGAIRRQLLDGPVRDHRVDQRWAMAAIAAVVVLVSGGITVLATRSGQPTPPAVQETVFTTPAGRTNSPLPAPSRPASSLPAPSRPAASSSPTPSRPVSSSSTLVPPTSGVQVAPPPSASGTAEVPTALPSAKTLPTDVVTPLLPPVSAFYQPVPDPDSRSTVLTVGTVTSLTVITPPLAATTRTR